MVKNHIWANEIRLRKDEIIDIINKEAGQEQIEDVIIKINPKSLIIEIYKNNITIIHNIIKI